MKFLIVFAISVFLALACTRQEKPDVNKFRQERKMIRLDRELFARDTTPDVVSIHQRYGRYFEIYATGILRLGDVRDSAFPGLLSLFLQDSVMREVYDTVAVHYKDMSGQERALNQAWAYYAYYFPGRLIPQVYTHISGFNQSVVVDSAAVGVSLDNYLGEDCIFYDMLATPVPRYARKKMTASDIPRDVVMGWMNVEFPFRPRKNDLLSGMIYQGKVNYVLEKLFPDDSLQYVFGFSRDQLKWCENNESQIWGFLVENEYLFSTGQKLLMKYLNDAPYTSGMPMESPGKTVSWTGYRIVKAYMDKRERSPEQLMEEQDYHRILRESGYRP